MGVKLTNPQFLPLGADDLLIKYVYIYKLVDPRTSEVRYVGKTTNLKYRLTNHISEAKKRYKRDGKYIRETEKMQWIKSLLKLQLKPILKIVAKVLDIHGEYWEEFYIKKYKYELNQNILNWDDKGKGTAGCFKPMVEKSILSRKRVIQYDHTGKKLNIFISLQEAEKATGIPHGNISRVCNGIYKQQRGFIFKYAEDKRKVKAVEIPIPLHKKVIATSQDGAIREFESIMQASRETGVDSSYISRICNGIYNKSSHKNIHFKFSTHE